MVAHFNRVLHAVLALGLLGFAGLELRSEGVNVEAALAGLGGVVLAISAATGKG